MEKIGKNFDIKETFTSRGEVICWKCETKEGKELFLGTKEVIKMEGTEIEETKCLIPQELKERFTCDVVITCKQGIYLSINKQSYYYPEERETYKVYPFFYADDFIDETVDLSDFGSKQMQMLFTDAKLLPYLFSAKTIFIPDKPLKDSIIKKLYSPQNYKYLRTFLLNHLYDDKLIYQNRNQIATSLSKSNFHIKMSDTVNTISDIPISEHIHETDSLVIYKIDQPLYFPEQLSQSISTIPYFTLKDIDTINNVVHHIFIDYLLRKYRIISEEVEILNHSLSYSMSLLTSESVPDDVIEPLALATTRHKDVSLITKNYISPLYPPIKL